MITAMDVEEYLSYLESYTKDGKLYTNREEGKARKLSSLKSFYDYYFKKNLIRTNPPRQVDVPKSRIRILSVWMSMRWQSSLTKWNLARILLRDSNSIMKRQNPGSGNDDTSFRNRYPCF